jgi:DNA topoisomerase-1
MYTEQETRGIRKARNAGLRYVHDLEDGWVRRRRGRGFTYTTARGKRLIGKRTLERIVALAIPPAWDDVRICPDADGHLQAIGRDAKGRQQYIYHDDWHAISSATKFDRLAEFGSLLPKIRRRVRRDLGQKGLTKDRVVAAIVRLIDKAHLRVGNPVYAEDNGSHGATTLTAEQVELDDITISLDFPGKSGKQTEAHLADAKVAAVVQQCEEINGQFLFCYRDNEGTYCSVSSSDVNGYLREVAETDLSAKDFRTWSASVIALKYLKTGLERQDGKVTKRLVTAAIRKTAEEMAHTMAVCRQSYIHPGLLAACESGSLGKLLREWENADREDQAELTRDESLFLAILPDLPG